ncbi:hypothetical protein BGZ68_007159 [Mortierella alpina]|nr:hypothetical protein BGZ68_007159 [Mortierella alpina]
MLGSIRTIFGIAAVTLCLAGVVFCIPDAGSPAAIQDREDAHFSAIRGREPAVVLEELTNTFRPGKDTPAWDSIYTRIGVRHSSDIQVLNRSDVDAAIADWGLPEDKVSWFTEGIKNAIQSAIDEGVHDVQGFRLINGSGEERSLNRTSVLCTVRVRQTGENHQWLVELGHIGIDIETTLAEHVRADIHGREMEQILDKVEFNWAISIMPVATVFLPEEPKEVLERRVMSDPRFEMIMKSVQLFAETWEKVAQAFSSNVTETVKRKVCLGFDSVAYHAESFVMQDVPESKMMAALQRIISANDLPPAANKGNILMGVEFSNKFTWIGENMIYRDSKGNQSFLFLAKHGNVVKTGRGRNAKTTKTVDIVYSRVKSNYLLAKDMLIVREQKSILGGIWKSDKTYINHVPHTLTPSDAQILQMFWQMIAYKQMAMATRVKAPKMPSLKGLCDRSMD